MHRLLDAVRHPCACAGAEDHKPNRYGHQQQLDKRHLDDKCNGSCDFIIQVNSPLFRLSKPLAMGTVDAGDLNFTVDGFGKRPSSGAYTLQFVDAKNTTDVFATQVFQLAADSQSESTKSSSSISNGGSNGGTGSGASLGGKPAPGIIAGVVLGALTLLSSGIAACFCIQRRRRLRRQIHDLEPFTGDGTVPFRTDSKAELIERAREGSREQVSPIQLRAMQRELEELRDAVGVGAEENEVLRDRMRVLEGELQLNSAAGFGGELERPPSYYVSD
ncbi:hypothetical protein FB45DRAFT_936773 [Roridomyces roridus]|uniref:Uncharacterized protein n=1 Tax=Roridomyces roridus TaxID=1738132 RepID=A0AAD7B9N6_9AGAR|nr:hypothetical protein FB45DRAFT_936773 [Roridomyces roridus]